MYFAQSIIVFAAVVFAAGFTLMSLRRIYAAVNTGQSEMLNDRISDRIQSILQLVFGHKKVLEDKSYGFMHFFYLYGFIILGIGHLELVVFGLSRFVETFDMQPILYRNILPAGITHIYELTQDLMAFLVLFVVTIALYKRIGKRVPRLLPRSQDAEVILWFIGALYLTFFVLIGTETFVRMQEGELALTWHWNLPISSLIALAIVKFPHSLVFGLNAAGWWTHLGVFLGFACYIPTSKHLHLICAAPNIYFRHFDTVAKPDTIDFDKAEKYGVVKVTDFSWKSLLDTFACTECGRCDAVCPARLTDKPLQPKKILQDIKLNLRYRNWQDIKQFRDGFGNILEGKEEEAEAFEPKVPLINREKIDPNSERVDDIGGYDIQGQLHLDEIWACTTCAACVEVCPVLIDSVPTDIIEIRRNLVLMEAKDYPKELNTAFRGMENQKNPWGISQDKRLDWAKELDVPLMSEQEDREVEYLFWVGCAGATDERAKKIQQALVRILKSAGVDFAILGCEEKCTGDPARRMGNEYLYDTLAKENIETLKKYRFKKMFATCPHCVNSLKNEYSDFGTNYSVQHHTELLSELMKDKRIPIDKKKEIHHTVTFHDPCYLGRYNNVYDPPRDVLEGIGVTIKEMPMSKKTSFCCGAGGGRMFMEEPIGKRINHERTDQIAATGADTVATGCPFCMTMLSDGVKDKQLEDNIQVKDIAELVAERLP